MEVAFDVVHYLGHIIRASSQSFRSQQAIGPTEVDADANDDDFSNAESVTTTEHAAEDEFSKQFCAHTLICTQVSVSAIPFRC